MESKARGGGVVVSTGSMVATLAAQINGLQVAVAGITVVFVVLTLLWMVLVLLNRFFPGMKSSAEVQQEQEEARVQPPSVTEERAAEPAPEPAIHSGRYHRQTGERQCAPETRRYPRYSHC